MDVLLRLMIGAMMSLKTSISLVLLSMSFMPWVSAEAEDEFQASEMKMGSGSGMRSAKEPKILGLGVPKAAVPAKAVMDEQIDRRLIENEALTESDTLRFVSDASGEELAQMYGETLDVLIPVTGIDRMMVPYGSESISDEHLKRLLRKARVIKKEDLKRSGQPLRCPVVIVTNQSSLYNLNLFDCRAYAGTLVTPQAKRFWFELSDSEK